MRKLVLFAFVMASIVSCSKVKKGEFIINGTAKGMPDGKTVILQTQNDAGGMINVDTLKVKDGKFEFKGKIKEPAIYALFFPDYSNGFHVIVENDEIDVEVKKDSINLSRISGTYNNDEFQKFNDQAKKIQKKMMDFQAKNRDVLQKAQELKDTATIDKLVKQNSDIQKELKDMLMKYPETHPKSYISTWIVLEMFMAPDYDQEKIRKLYNGFDPSIKNTKTAKKIKEQLDFLKATNPPASKSKPVSLNVGQMAPDFIANTPDGTAVSLKKLLGKVTIIDFWASWCGPCRDQNPAIVALYNEFHAKGLNIVGVSLDDNAVKWKEAIAMDKLAWTHVSNLMKWKDPIAVQYNIQQTPTTFLLDNTGKIVAKDLSGAALKAKVAELLSAS